MPLSTMSTPDFRYYVSEAYGGNTPDPTTAPIDPDVHLETDLSLLEDAIYCDDPDEFKRVGAGVPPKINSRGREISLPRHMIGILVSWQNKYAEALREHNVFNGFFQNYAPRDERFRNGPPFYVVEFADRQGDDAALRMVTTFPGDILKGVRDQVRYIAQIPNEGNPIFSDAEQFRSKDAHRWLRRNASDKYPVSKLSDGEAADALETEYYPVSTEGLPLKFVDTYGNMIFENNHAVRQLLLSAAESSDRQVKLSVNGITHQAEATTSLGRGTDGSFLVYPNAGNIDVVRKWRKGESSTFTTNNSAFRQFSRKAEDGDESHNGLILPQEIKSGLRITFEDHTFSSNAQSGITEARVA